MVELNGPSSSAVHGRTCGKAGLTPLTSTATARDCFVLHSSLFPPHAVRHSAAAPKSNGEEGESDGGSKEESAIKTLRKNSY